MSGLIWIQIVWHSDGIPERIMRKIYLEKKSADDIKACKITAKDCKGGNFYILYMVVYRSGTSSLKWYLNNKNLHINAVDSTHSYNV